MKAIDLDETRMQLSDLLHECSLGGHILLIKNDRPVAHIYGIPEATIERQPGAMKGRIWISDDFDDPLPDDIQAAFDGK